jgi:hypothetical protein
VPNAILVEPVSAKMCLFGGAVCVPPKRFVIVIDVIAI